MIPRAHKLAEIDESSVSLLVGSRNGDIINMDIDISGDDYQFNPTVISKNHSTQTQEGSSVVDKFLRIALHPKLSIMASIGRDKSLYIWNIEDNVIMDRYFLSSTSQITCLKYNQDGTMLCLGYSDGTTRLYQSTVTEIEYKRDQKGMLTQ